MDPSSKPASILFAPRFGGYDDLDAWADYDFWCKFVENGLAAAFVPEILRRYRVHGASMLQASRADHNDLIVEMSLRHPWLDLRGSETD